MADMVAILAALPREIRGLVKGLKPVPELRAQGVWLYRTERAVVVTAGMGAARVSAAFDAARRQASIGEVVSVGLAGACTAATEAGAVLAATLVIDARTGERFRTMQDSAECVLVSTEAIASVQEKARLAASYGAAMVDMEAATAARLALAHGLPFRAVKAISDPHDFELESLGQFAGKNGQFRTAAFALHTALRPRTWGQAATLGRNSNRALTALWAELSGLVGETSRT